MVLPPEELIGTEGSGGMDEVCCSTAGIFGRGRWTGRICSGDAATDHQYVGGCAYEKDYDEGEDFEG